VWRLKEVSPTPDITLAQLCDSAGLDEKAREGANPDMPVRAWVEQLARTGMHRETVAALAQLLPKRDTIGWGLGAVRRIQPPAAGTPAGTALESVEHWLENPDDERRHLASDAAKRAGYGSPAGCLALAVFLSGGNMAPKNTAASAEPPPHLCGRTVAGSISLAVASDPPKAPQSYRAVLEDGFRLAEQTGVWKAAERRA